jgi:hypothetical protein
VKGLPAGAAACLARAHPRDGVAHPHDPAELLAIEMDQFAWAFTFVAAHGQPLFQVFQPSKPQAAQDRAHGGTRQLKPPGDGRPGEPLLAQAFDRGNLALRQAMAQTAGDRPGVMERRRSPAAIAGEPFVGGPFGNACRFGGPCDRPALLLNAADHQRSAVRRQACILMSVHPRLRLRGDSCGNPTFSSNFG